MSGLTKHHAEWLSLIEISGPFLTLPVLLRVFPQGLPKQETEKLSRLRAAYEEWAEAQEGSFDDAPSVHAAWIQFVLNKILELDAGTLRPGDRLLSRLAVSMPEHQETIQPSMAVVEPTGRIKADTPRLLIATWPLAQNLESTIPDARWVATPIERMTQLCRSTGVRLGLVTNGERWTLVDAPIGQTAGYASWYAGIWLQEPLTLTAFEALLGARRFFAASAVDTLEAMLDESVAYQQEVTDQLGYQVRRAVEVLVQALDRADLDRGRDLLRDVSPDRLYEASLTIMMRLVFLFCAEERGLLLLGDETYDSNYAVSTLRALLREEADRVGVEVLERRQDAWARLIAISRVVFAGIEHEALRLPALGGSLFDPDRFPFLEGRAASTSWLDTAAFPLPIDNRTVLHLLEALQLLRMRGDSGTGEARKLSYRALDIEQIGHVYEGLLDHAAVRIKADTVGLAGTKDKEPELTIDELDQARRGGDQSLLAFLSARTGRSVSALRNDLTTSPDDSAEQRLLVACGNDKALLQRVLPYHALIRNDAWGYPQVYPSGALMVTGVGERRQTGTHYTPKSLTEKIVTETLEPLVYAGPVNGKPREEWELRSPVELLTLKICDMAMGSAAFLVQVCRWLGDRLVESWDQAERDGYALTADGLIADKTSENDLLPEDRAERLNYARRLIAERCVYGVDINPMAVELAKLSLWLVTLARGRPFGFLDHNLRCGDSLVGVTRLDQLEDFHLDPKKGKEQHRNLFDPRERIKAAFEEALALRITLRSMRIIDIRDVHAMANVDSKAKGVLERAELVADLLVGAALSSAGRAERLDEQIGRLADMLTQWLSDATSGTINLRAIAATLLATDNPVGRPTRRPLHWVLEFPEVFARKNGGFDAIIGNPPFMGGQKITGNLGTSYREYLVTWLADGARGSADLVAYFFLGAYKLLRDGGNFGLLATNTISEGDTRQVGLEMLTRDNAVIFATYPNEPWPGKAAVMTSRVHIHKGAWGGTQTILGRPVPHISALLSDRDEWTPKRLTANDGIAFQGSIVLGMGFVLSDIEAGRMIESDGRNAEVLFPYLNGEDLNTDPAQQPSRWVINFWDWPEEKAKEYEEPYSIVRQRVKPERDALRGTTSTDRRRKEKWWLFGSDAKSLYHAIGRGHAFYNHPVEWNPEMMPLARVLVTCRVTKYLAPALLENTPIFTLDTFVFARDDFAFFALIQGAVHEVWARRFGSTHETRLRYTASDVFLTMPLPDVTAEGPRGELDAVGGDLERVRHHYMVRAGVGLTKTYNLVHNQGCLDREIQNIRDAHVATDRAILRSYGWSDIELDHDFRPVRSLPEKDRVRFTPTEDARQEILLRLIDLNRARHQEEVDQDFSRRTSHVSDLGVMATRTAAYKLPFPHAEVAYGQPLLGFGGSFAKAAEAPAKYREEAEPARKVRDWLTINRGWHTRQEILAAIDATVEEWLAAIRNLRDTRSVVERNVGGVDQYRAKRLPRKKSV